MDLQQRKGVKDMEDVLNLPGDISAVNELL